MAVDDDLVVVLDDADVPVLSEVQEEPVASHASAPVISPPSSLGVEPPDDVGRTAWLYGLTVLADHVSRQIGTEHHTDHVALYRRDGDEYLIIGGVGLTSALRAMRIACDHPAVRVALTRGGLLIDAVRARDSQVRDLPGGHLDLYAVYVDDQLPIVDLVTVSGRNIEESNIMDIVEKVRAQAREWAGARSADEFNALLAEAV